MLQRMGTDCNHICRHLNLSLLSKYLSTAKYPPTTTSHRWMHAKRWTAEVHHSVLECFNAKIVGQVVKFARKKILSAGAVAYTCLFWDAFGLESLWNSWYWKTLQGRKKTKYFGDTRQLDDNKETCVDMVVLKANESWAMKGGWNIVLLETRCRRDKGFRSRRRAEAYCNLNVPTVLILDWDVEIKESKHTTELVAIDCIALPSLPQ
jgi:hypothetical protein